MSNVCMVTDRSMLYSLPRSRLFIAALCNMAIYIFMLWFLMAALRSRCGYYIFALWFLLSSSSSFFISSPNLSHRRLDVYHTFTVEFHPHRCNDKGVGPPKLKLLLRFDRNVKYNAPQGRIPCRFSQNLQSLYLISGCVRF